MRFPQLVLSDSMSKLMLWRPLQAPVIGGQLYRVPSCRAEEWMDHKLFFDALPHGVELNEEERAYEGKGSETSVNVTCQG